jgi:hypothetical protein
MVMPMTLGQATNELSVSLDLLRTLLRNDRGMDAKIRRLGRARLIDGPAFELLRAALADRRPTAKAAG